MCIRDSGDASVVGRVAAEPPVRGGTRPATDLHVQPDRLTHREHRSARVVGDLRHLRADHVLVEAADDAVGIVVVVAPLGRVEEVAMHLLVALSLIHI